MNRRLDKSTVALIIVIVVASWLFAASLIVFSGGNRRAIETQNAEYLEDATRRMADNIDAQITDGYDNIKIVANLLSDSRKPEVDVNQLRELVRNSVFDFIEFADTEGWDHTVMNTKTFAGDRKYYIEGVKQGKVGMELVYNSRATHETLLMFYAPVYFGKEIIGAVIGVYQAANKITKLLSTDYFGENALSYLATPEGRIVASSEGYDPSVESYIDSLPGGGCICKLDSSGWVLVQYFPEKATDAMAARVNALGYNLSAILFGLYALILVAVVIYLRRKHKIHQEEMVVALAQAEKANKAKTSFLNSMSHDIRTPMNAITGFNMMALRELGKDDVKVRDCLEKVQKSSDVLLHIINDILEISRIESGKVALSEERSDVTMCFSAIEPMMGQLAAESGLDLTFSFGDIQDRYVICDRSHVARIITNLVGNAVKYSRKGGWVKVGCEQIGRRDDSTAVFKYTVEDNGIGMGEDFQKELFQPFSREQTSTVSKIQGTGLGLAMCRDLVMLMSGQITCESEKGRGTLFTVILPFKIQKGGRFYVEPTTVPKKQGGDFKGKHILLVEDNALNREIATAILEDYGIVITPAEDGDIAVEKMKAAAPGEFDLVLMDIQMPTMDGYEATRQIRALGTEISKIPIIAMTANAFAEDRQLAMEAGMNGHLSKPIDITALKSALGLYL